jgi:hypothetical protein
VVDASPEQGRVISSKASSLEINSVSSGSASRQMRSASVSFSGLMNLTRAQASR